MSLGLEYQYLDHSGFVRLLLDHAFLLELASAILEGYLFTDSEDLLLAVVPVTGVVAVFEAVVVLAVGDGLEQVVLSQRHQGGRLNVLFFHEDTFIILFY